MNCQPIMLSEGGYAPNTYSDEGVTFTPVYDIDTGAIGFRVEHLDRPPRYVLLNPSGGTDTGEVDDSDVFVYLENAESGMSLLNPKCYINIWDKQE